MSKVTDCKRSADSASRKRRQSSEQQDESASNTPRKLTKVGNARNETPSTSSLSHKNGEAEKPEEPAGKQAAEHREGDEAGDVKTGKESSSNGASAANSSVRQDGPDDGPDVDGSSRVTAEKSPGPSRVTAEKSPGPSRVTVEKAPGPSRVTVEKASGSSRVTAEKAQGPSRVTAEKAPGPSRVTAEKGQGPSRLTAEKAHGSDAAKADAEGEHCPSTSLDHQSDSAAIAAAEALASLTGGKGKEGEETPCSSERAGRDRPGGKVKRTGHESSKGSSKTQAAAADSSTSVHSIEREAAEDIGDGDDGDDSIPGSSSTPSSSFPSDNDDNDGSECAIVSVKMAPEIRQSVALLSQVQMKLEALDKKSARLHQRLDLKMSRQQRPHLDWRRSITQTIPGFWVTALLNHPHLSAHIDETDEDALSYMTDLEIESFKGNKVGHRIRFHFKRNPYFQNNIIMKEVHLGMGGPPVSFSNPILWHRGQNLTAHSEPRKTSRGVYQTFFSWFSDHSNPGRDDIAQILKDDLWRDPLRYYLTPLWEPRENGSGSSGTKAPDNSNRDECVVISDSDEDQEQDEADEGHSREEEEEDGDDDEEEAGQDSDESPEEDEAGQIMTDGSDDREDEDEEDEKDEDVYVEELDESSMDHKTRDPNDDEDVEVDEEDDSKD